MNKSNEIRIHELTKIYKNETVLEHLTHSFAAGAIHGIVGRNGSGKTTLLRLICGIAVPTEGEIWIGTKCVSTKDGGEFPSNIGILIENPGFIPQYSGYKNLAYLASIQKRIGKKEIENAMVQVGLSPSNKKWVSKYSLGMKQRLGIAQAIMEKPDILLLDEPMNGLDKDGVTEIYTLLNGLRSQGVTILFASHNADDISQLCDTVIELDHGHMSVLR